MRKENLKSDKVQELPVRVTRSRATAFLGSQPINKKRPLQTLPKKSSGDENADNAGLQHKRRAVLQNVTNVFCDNSFRNCFNASSIQAKWTKPVKKSRAKLTKVTPCVVEAFPASEADLKEKTVLEREKSDLKQDRVSEADCFGSFPLYEFGSQSSVMTSHLQSPSKRVAEAEKGYLYKNTTTTPRNPDVIDIDDQNDPRLCCVYAPDMYENLHVAELARRPRPDFMETIQRDITQSMRGILVDWLVEVSEEYKLVPDTLYLAVYLIDRFLSENYIERHRLQLIGVTCMLISSKYEEICAPRVEEFCFITDSTYTREEVLKMEVQILKYYNFQLFAPTAKSFLRRFLRAAQVSYTSPSLELEYLANYLAELTLVDYSFLNFLPSVIAASAIFLSRWTLDPTSHPWNPTLEYYTSYKSPDLKSAVIALQDLQLNTNGCPLSSIRTKYRNQRFKCVAALSSQKPPETLFSKTE